LKTSLNSSNIQFLAQIKSPVDDFQISRKDRKKTEIGEPIPENKKR
jgi:hypothetical protein